MQSLQLSANQEQMPHNWNLISKETNLASIITTESYATFRHVLPSAIAWIWRKIITNEIETIELRDDTNHVAYLNIHGKISSFENRKITPVIFNHGDHGHPFSMLHLADIAESKGMPTFSLYIPDVENDERFANHNQFLKQAIDKIETIIQKNDGVFDGILGVGHSKGAILLSMRLFVDLDPRLKAICSIAGRLNIIEENDIPSEALTNIIKKIYNCIVSNPEKPLFQIVPKDDWNAPQTAMKVRPNKYCFTVPGMHLSGLFQDETKKYFKNYISEFT